MQSVERSSRITSIHPSPSGQSNRASQIHQSRGGYSVFDLLGELQFHAKGNHVGLDILQAKFEQFDEDSRLKWSRSNYEKEDLKFQRDALKEESAHMLRLNEELREVIQEKVQELEKKEQEHAVDLERFKKLCDEMVRNISQEKHRGGEERTFEVQVTESNIEGGSYVNNTRGEVKRAAHAARVDKEEGANQGGIMDEILRLKEELRQNQVKLSQKEKEAVDNSEQKKEIEALKVQIKEAEAERKKIIEEFRNSEAERVERYEKRIQELEETLEKLKKESEGNVKGLTAEAEKLKKESEGNVKELTAQAEKLKKEAQNLKQEANSQREIAETLRNETVGLKEEIEGLKKEIEGLKKTVSVKEKEAEKLDREVKSIRASASANKEALSEKEFEREETQLELERLRESVSEFEEKLKTEEEKYKKLQEEHKKTLKSEQAHKADVLAKLKDLEGLVEKYAQKEQELEKDLAEANKSKETLVLQVEGSDKKISELEKSLEKSKKSEEESRQKLSHETRRSSGREQEIGSKLRELEDLVEQYRKAAEQNEKALAEANSKANAEKQEKEETLAKIAKLEEELAKVKGAKEEHERALNEANGKLEKLQQEKQEMAARIQELEKEVAKLSSAGEQQGGESSKVTEELEKLHKEGEKKEKEFEKLEGEVKKKNDSVEELRREVEEKEKIISGLKVRMGLMTEKVEEAEREAKDFESLRKILREMSENLNMNVKNLSQSPKALTALLTQVKIKLQEVDDKFNQEKEKDVTIRRKLERAESQVLASKESGQKHKKEIDEIKQEYNEKIEQLEKINLDLERRLLSQSQSSGENKADDDRERLINHIQSLENNLHGARSELSRLEKEAEKSVSLQEEINRLTLKLQEEQEKWTSTREVVHEVITTTEEQPKEERKMRGARRPLPEEELPKRGSKPNLEIKVEEDDLVVVTNDETAKVELELKKVQEDRDILQRRIEELEAGYGQRMEEMNQEIVKKDEHIVALKFDVDQMKEWITERHGDDVFEKPGADAGNNNINEERTPVTIYEDREFMKETGSVLERLDSPEIIDDSLSNASRGILRSPERGSQTSKHSDKKKLKKQNWSLSFKTPKGGDVVSISYDPKQRVQYNSLSAMKFDASENATPRNSERDSVKTTESRRDRRKERENDPAYQQLEKMIMELKEKLVQSEKKTKAEMNQKIEDIVKANNEKEDKLREEMEKLIEEKKALEKKLDDIQWEHTYEIQNLLKEKATEEAKDEKAAADGTPKDGEAAKKKKKKKK